jgi:RecB family exonuclease
MTLSVYPTTRALSSILASHKDEHQLYTKAITIGDFFTKAIIVDNRVSIDDSSRVLLLNESIDFDKIKKLGFEKDFISFIKNSEFIFKFFDEVFAEGLSVEQINRGDIYSEYSDHLDILTYIYKSYKDSLNEHGYYDRATIDKYELNTPFFENFSRVEIYLEGIMTNIEFEVLQKLSSVIPLYIHIEHNRFNNKMVSKFVEYGVKLGEYGSYVINMSNKECDSFSSFVSATSYDVASFSSDILQCAYIFKKIHEYVEVHNLEPSRVAIILPDESFATILRDFDTKNNLNFAMGIPFNQSRFFKSLQAIYLYIVEYNKENLQRVEKLELLETIEYIKTKIKDSDNIELLFEIIDRLKEHSTQKQKELIEAICYKIEKFSQKLKRYKFRDVLSFALRLYNEQKIDDVQGGKIRVIGVLESRAIEFDGVIIPSFNEGVVPKVSTKDIFLNSHIKAMVNLPTKKDREELQKYYYSRVFSNSKYVSISYVNSDEKGASRFLKELGLNESTTEDSRYQDIIFNKPATINHYDTAEVIDNTWSSMELSATRLSIFLSCKRKFYYSYIKGLESPSIENRDKLTLGNIFHNAFSKIIDSSYSDANRLKDAIKTEVLNNLKDINLKFDVYKWLKYLDKFCQVEVDRFNSGVSVLEKEQTHKIEYNGLKLMGRVDRVDIKGNNLFIIDYKIKENIKLDTIKTYENSRDFQLEFYYLFMKHKYQYQIDSAYVYDVKNAKLVEEVTLFEKLAMLDEKLEEFKAPSIEISKCEDKSICRYCTYKTLCDRG